MAAFIYKKSMNPNGGRELMEFAIADAQTLSVGEAVKLTGDALTCETAGAGGAALGVISSFVKADGSPLTDNGAGGDFVGTYLTPSSNTVRAVVDVSQKSVYSVTADATLGTTTGSDMIGYTMDTVAASNQLDESTALTTAGTWVSLGPDPDGSAPTNSVLVVLYESDIWNF